MMGEGRRGKRRTGTPGENSGRKTYTTAAYQSRLRSLKEKGCFGPSCTTSEAEPGAGIASCGPVERGMRFQGQVAGGTSHSTPVMVCVFFSRSPKHQFQIILFWEPHPPFSETTSHLCGIILALICTQS